MSKILDTPDKEVILSEINKLSEKYPSRGLNSFIIGDYLDSQDDPDYIRWNLFIHSDYFQYAEDIASDIKSILEEYISTLEGFDGIEYKIIDSNMIEEQVFTIEFYINRQYSSQYENFSL